MKAAFALALAVSAGACATTPISDIDAFARNSGRNSFEIVEREVGSGALVLPIAHDAQTSGRSCGAHALASVINYWRPNSGVRGAEIMAARPPQHEQGYSLAELVALARDYGLQASAVRLSNTDIESELERGRPVIVPVRVPAIYLQTNTWPVINAPIVGFVPSVLNYRVGRVSEFTDLALVEHYLVMAGFSEDTFVVVEPILGYRTISQRKLARYRRSFEDAALVLSGPYPAS